MASFRSDRGARKPYARPTPRMGAEGQWLHDRAPTGPRADLNGPARPKPTPNLSAAPNNRILVSNLHYEITAKDLTAIFGQIGTLVREPLIRYDRSGRSSGTAIITFETPAEAIRAKNQYEGIAAKGQPMTIVPYSTPIHPRRSASAPVTSLLHRIQKPPLVDRISRDDTHTKSIPKGPGGPVRTRPQRPGPGRATRPGPKKPKTAEELDKELDAFMGDSDTAPVATQEKVGEEVVQDVDMV